MVDSLDVLGLFQVFAFALFAEHKLALTDKKGPFELEEDHRIPKEGMKPILDLNNLNLPFHLTLLKHLKHPYNLLPIPRKLAPHQIIDPKLDQVQTPILVLEVLTQLNKRLNRHK